MLTNKLFSRAKSNIINGTLLKKPQCIQNKLNNLSDATKMQYYARISKKQIDPTASAKNIMVNLKRCLHEKKIPCISPLFHHKFYN